MNYKNLKKQALEDLAGYTYLKRQQENIPKQIKLLQNSTLYKSYSAQANVMSSADSDKKMISHITRIENLEKLLCDVNFKADTMENAFTALTEEEKQLLFSYYINRQRQSVLSLSIDMHTDRSWLYRKADRALKKYILAYFGTLGE